jgi:hypothetical protein
VDSSLLETALNNQVLSILAVLSFLLLIVVTLGVAYLTSVEWRDRRRRGNEAAALPTFRAAPASPKAASAKTSAKADGRSKRKKDKASKK